MRRRREEERRQEASRADRNPHRLQEVPGGTVAVFDGSCRFCGSAFQYRGLALVFPNMDPRPAFPPATVCEAPACRQRAEAEREAAEAARMAQERSDLIEAARRRFVEQVPDRYHRRAAIAAAADEHLIAELRDWTVDQSVYLHGPSGHGKSHQAACLVRRAVLAGYDVRWVSARDLVQSTLEAIRRKADRPWIVSNPRGVKVLVVNDAYAETATGFAAGLLGDLYDARYEAGLPIVWTSNIAPGQITNTVDTGRRDAATVATELERQRGRILEMTAPGSGVLVRHEQRDWRAAIAAGEV